MRLAISLVMWLMPIVAVAHCGGPPTVFPNFDDSPMWDVALSKMDWQDAQVVFFDGCPYVYILFKDIVYLSELTYSYGAIRPRE